MTEANLSCDLCMLPVADDRYRWLTVEGEKHFCCEGCLGIYQMLNPQEDALQPIPAETREGERS